MHRLAHRVNRPSLFERVMGEPFAALHPALRRFHRLSDRHLLHGEVTTHAPTSPLAALLSRALGSPRVATSGPIRFELDVDAAVETWTRHFPGRTMSSRLREVDGELVEQLGAARLVFALEEDAGQLRMRLRAMRFLGVPCPAFLRPRIVAEETGELHANGRERLHFRVEATVLLIGQVVGYRGHLWLPDDPAGEAAWARG
jgi:hypothetical protein